MHIQIFLGIILLVSYLSIVTAPISKGNFRIQISTWKIDKEKPPACLKSFLGIGDLIRNPDVLVVGLQTSTEVPLPTELQIKQNENCSPNEFLRTRTSEYLHRGIDIIKNEINALRTSTEEQKSDENVWKYFGEWGKSIEDILSKNDYERIGKIETPGNVLAIYALKYMKIQKNAIKSNLFCFNVPFSNPKLNSDSVGFIVNIFDKKMVFVSTNLPKHRRNQDARFAEIDNIFQAINNIENGKDVIFLFGTLNFNSDAKSPSAEVKYKLTKPVYQKRPASQEEKFKGPPSYRFNRESDCASTWQQGVAYCTYNEKVEILDTYYDINEDYVGYCSDGPIDSLFYLYVNW